MAGVGVAIFCIAGMKNVERCVESAAWADHIEIVQLEKGGAIRNSAVPRRAGDWTLHLWGEEVVGKRLAAELSSLRARSSARAPTAYRVRVRSLLLGRRVGGSLWGPNPALRLTREPRPWPPAWWDAHETGNEALLSGCIEDHVTAELDRAIRQMNVLTSVWAETLRSQGKAPGLVRAAAFSSLQFVREAARHALAADGLAGLTLSVLAAYTALVTAAKAWEQEGSPGGSVSARRGPGRAPDRQSRSVETA
ncbi:MAG TPA: hypothetical protein VNL14_00505 [Candidatus Acidoferrales bacterium]|nr:hypothetical protein [Candidatus Acidoferrales bacterium]